MDAIATLYRVIMVNTTRMCIIHVPPSEGLLINQSTIIDPTFVQIEL